MDFPSKTVKNKDKINERGYSKRKKVKERERERERERGRERERREREREREREKERERNKAGFIEKKVFLIFRVKIYS